MALWADFWVFVALLEDSTIFLLVTGFCTVLRRGGSLAIKARLYFDLVLAGILLAFHCLEDGCRVRWELLPYALRLWEGLETTESCGDPEEICRVTRLALAFGLM